MKYITVLILLTTMNLEAQISDFEGNLYDTVRIGNQVWIKENIKSTKYSDGTPITTGIYAYNNNTINVTSNGYLYSYATTVRNTSITPTQGICPNNFHVPDQTDWGILFNYIGSTSVGPNLISNADMLKDDSNWNGINTYNFSLFPSGSKSAGSGYFGLSTQVWYWVAGSSSNDLVYYFDNGPYIKIYPNMATTNSNDAMPCRCVMNVNNVGINEVDYINGGFKIFPNPNNGEFSLVLNKNIELPKSITIKNLLGEEIETVLNTGSYEYNFNLNDLPNGLYIINIVYSNKIISKKLIKS